MGGHVALHEFGTWTDRKEPTDCEIQIYTWPEATLREIEELVREVLPSIQNCVLAFALIYADKRGDYVMRSVGRGNMTLRQAKYQAGDFLSISISEI